MFITRLSRYRYCLLVQLDDGTMFLTDREPFRYTAFDDNRVITAKRGDTWWTLAARFFRSDGVIQFPERLWWIIADFQPQPAVDPTIRIQPGSLVHIPSLNAVFQYIFNDDRKVLHR